MGDLYQNILFSKYKGICQRSFKTRLELFLFEKIVNKTEIFSLSESDFLTFQITDELIQLYEWSWQVEEIMFNGCSVSCRLIDSEIINWNKQNDLLKSLIFKKYEDYFATQILPLEQFKIIFPEDPKERICHYTGLSDYDFELLRKNGQIKTKNSRGRYMEIDRLNSNKEYEPKNIVLACYWANNAKTDEFLYPEFLQSVGPAMRQVFLHRIGKINGN